MGRKTMATVRKALEEELDLLADQYHEEPESLPHGLIALAVGRTFARQCLKEYGFEAYQFAGAGIQAILDSIRSKPQG